MCIWSFIRTPDVGTMFSIWKKNRILYPVMHNPPFRPPSRLTDQWWIMLDIHCWMYTEVCSLTIPITGLRAGPQWQKSLLVHKLYVYAVFRTPKSKTKQNKQGRLICLVLPCEALEKVTDLLSFSWCFGRKGKVAR